MICANNAQRHKESFMSAIHPDIESLLDRISRHGDSDLSTPSVPHLSLTVIGDLFDLDFYGDPAGEAFGELSETLSLNQGLQLRCGA